MGRAELQTGIERNANTNLQIGMELADIVEFLIVNGHIPGGPAINTPDLTSQCQQATYQRVRRLVNEMAMVNQFDQGPTTYVIHTRLNEIVNGQNLTRLVNEELDRISTHAQQNPAVRQVVANARGVPVGQALQGLFGGDFIDRRSRLDNLVRAIQSSPNVNQGNYGRIIFRMPPNLYLASPLAVQLYGQ